MRMEWIERVLAAMPGDGEPPKSSRQIADETGLPQRLIGPIVAALRDMGTQLPLVSGADGYRFTLSSALLTRFYLWRIRSARTILRRLLMVLGPYWNATLPAGEVTRRQRQMTRVLEDLEEDLTLLSV